MKKTLSVLMVVVAGFAALLGAAPSASAYNGYGFSASNVNYTADGCYSGRITVSGFRYYPDEYGYSDETYDVDVYAPNGAWVDSDFVYDTSSTTLRPFLCNWSDPVGRYSVRVNGVEVGAFSVARPALSVRAVSLRTRQARVQGRLLLRGAGMAGRHVALQRYQYGSWLTKRSLTTNRYGYVAAQCPKRKTMKGCKGTYRFAHNGVAASRAFHLPKRR